MSMSASDAAKLQKIILLAKELLGSINTTKSGRAPTTKGASGKRIRRSGKDLVAFRKMLKAERKMGARVDELASKHGVSTAYIYQLGS